MSRSLSRREKGLAAAVGAVVFLFGNFLLIDWAWSSALRLRTDIAAKTKQIRMIATLTEERAFWEQREAWLQAKQPRLANADTAAVELLNRVQELTKKHTVLLENPVIRVPGPQPEYVSISVEVETKSPWKPLIAFLQELQSPEQFIAMESANLKIDAADATQMRGRFRIARWYAPR